jgi:hypothetical protein
MHEILATLSDEISQLFRLTQHEMSFLPKRVGEFSRVVGIGERVAISARGDAVPVRTNMLVWHVVWPLG